MSNKTSQKRQLEGIIRCILKNLPDVDAEVIANTPRRIVRAYEELLKGYEMNPENILKEFEIPNKRVHVYETCEFYSLCEHHMLPFYGKVHIAYTAANRAFGLSKLARLVEVYSKRLQLQERLTDQIAQALFDAINTPPRGYLDKQARILWKSSTINGVFVVVEAKHLCMSMRGIKKQDAVTITKAARGIYERNAQLRSEFLAILRSKKAKT
jgi:GTP cyclohydrolase I